MSGFENRIATLLQDAVPEPGIDIDVATVERLGRRRRAVAVAAPVVGVLVVIVAMVVAIALAGRADKPVQPATSKYTIDAISLQYPREWRAAMVVFYPDLGHERLVADNPTSFVTSQPVANVCQFVASRGQQFCHRGVRQLADDGVYVGFNTFRPNPPDTVGASLDTTLAGRPASVIERVNVNEFCPTGTASTTDAVISLGRGEYLSILGCLGSADAAKQAFQNLLDSARYTP